jgi:hypothetical protein
VVFKDSAGQWRDCRTATRWWLVDGEYCSAISRDLLAEAMIRIEAAKLSDRVHVHDKLLPKLKVSAAPKNSPSS